jgi:hypothetical protein
MTFISYTCWVIYVLTLAIFFVYCCYVLLLRRWEVRWWRLLLDVQKPRSTVCGKMGSIPLFSHFWTCNKFFLIRYDIIKTLVFCVYILTVCMITWSWTYIRWASGFDLKNRVWQLLRWQINLLCGERYHNNLSNNYKAYTLICKSYWKYNKAQDK